jgi:fructose-bisphosphate aldolase class II
MKAINAILEVEIGVVGGEEDGVKHEGSNEALYTTTADVSRFVEALGLGENGRYIAALTFGNVHGVYKPGNVKLRPELLGEIQAGIAERFGTGAKPSTSSSTAAAARRRRRSRPPSPTAS